ncbi:MAG: hypothetical protein OK454_11065, partial [Thaumarchaeota archaeon]|nr:hypothetical protein [Nitrososphaerota archaeon]
DNVLKRYRQSEDQYWDNWIKARNKFYEADAMSRASHEEREKYEEMRERAEKYEKQVEDTRKNVREALEKQAKILVADNQRLTDYWEFNKAVTDEQVAKETLAAGKRDLSDKNALDEIQKRVEAATKRAGEKSKDFQEKYSNDFNKNNFTNQEDLVDLDMEKLRAMSAANLTDIRKSLEGRLNRIKADYDDKMSDIKKELEFIEKNSPDYELHSKSARKKTQDLFNRFTKEREDLKKKIEAIDNHITSQRLGGTNVADKITENPKNITDVGKRELGQEGVKAAVTDAVAQAPAPTVAKIEDLLEDKVQHYFEQGKILVEDNLGKPIDAKHYQHLVNDLVKLSGRLTIYYKEKSEKEQVSG